MKKIICSLLIILTIFLSSCTDNTPSPNENNIQKEKFIGTWVCEIYNNEDKKLIIENKSFVKKIPAK